MFGDKCLAYSQRFHSSFKFCEIEVSVLCRPDQTGGNHFFLALALCAEDIVMLKQEEIFREP